MAKAVRFHKTGASAEGATGSTRFWCVDVTPEREIGPLGQGQQLVTEYRSEK